MASTNAIQSVYHSTNMSLFRPFLLFSNPFLPLTCKFESHLHANSPSRHLNLSSTPRRSTWVPAPRHTLVVPSNQTFVYLVQHLDGNSNKKWDQQKKVGTATPGLRT